MTVETTIQVAGLQEALKTLNKIEPELRKQFLRDVNELAEPALKAARDAYKFLPLSGTERAWDGTGVERRAAGRISGRKVFPLDIDKARKGIKIKLDTRRKATSTILIQQTDPGWAIFETAGRKTVNPLGTQLGHLDAGKTRLFGRAVFANRDKIEAAVARIAIKVVNRVNTDFRRAA
jgi:hypothetical protein